MYALSTVGDRVNDLAHCRRSAPYDGVINWVVLTVRPGITPRGYCYARDVFPSRCRSRRYETRGAFNAGNCDRYLAPSEAIIKVYHNPFDHDPALAFIKAALYLRAELR